MGTKNNPSKFDCYEKARPDEPMFVLLGRDPLAPMLVTLWANLREYTVADDDKINEAICCAEAMKRYRAASHIIPSGHLTDTASRVTD